VPGHKMPKAGSGDAVQGDLDRQSTVTVDELGDHPERDPAINEGRFRNIRFGVEGLPLADAGGNNDFGRVIRAEIGPRMAVMDLRCLNRKECSV